MSGLFTIASQVLGGWLLADLLSGLLHWIEDRFGRPEMPLLGPLFFAPNQLHHQQPVAFTRAGFFERNGTTWLITAIIGAAVAWVFGPSIWLATAVVGGAFASQVHYWAHRAPRVPRPVAVAQRLGVLQSKYQHQLHHAAPHLRRYCILTDWLNPVLDALGFWRLLEMLVPAKWLAR